jgi:hypothetical protein
MTLFWLKAYKAYEVLGFFYELNKTNIEDNLKAILATLDTMTSFTYDHPSPKQRKLRSPKAMMEAFPQVHLVIDAKEKSIQRPKTPIAARGNPSSDLTTRAKRRRIPLIVKLPSDPMGTSRQYRRVFLEAAITTLACCARRSSRINWRKGKKQCWTKALMGFARTSHSCV